MPVLRFARDRRGYESTYLVETARKGNQESGSLLYWFRTPPHVKVGRAAFDEDAIRLLEQQHPDSDFDWDRILTAKPPAAPEPRDARGARPERRGPREARREDGRGRPAAPVERRDRPAVASPPRPAPRSEESQEQSPPAPVIAAPPPEPAIPSPAPAPVEPPALAAPARRFVRVFDRTPEPGAPQHATEPSAAERRLGAEQLTILRARYAEVLARIASRGGEPARVESLREQAERVNPDGWVTDEEVAAGLAAMDGVLAELHQQVGRRRRRRRRGGRGRGPESPATGSAAVLATADGAESRSDDADLEDDDGPDE